MLVACNFSGDALEAELQASILGVLGQFWTFLQAKQVSERIYCSDSESMMSLWEAAAILACLLLSCFTSVGPFL